MLLSNDNAVSKFGYSEELPELYGPDRLIR
jgi:hypothetical protein